jgi:hypothetical protein
MMLARRAFASGSFFHWLSASAAMLCDGDELLGDGFILSQNLEPSDSSCLPHRMGKLEESNNPSEAAKPIMGIAE